MSCLCTHLVFLSMFFSFIAKIIFFNEENIPLLHVEVHSLVKNFGRGRVPNVMQLSGLILEGFIVSGFYGGMCLQRRFMTEDRSYVSISQDRKCMNSMSI